jgi:hypothetical protein
MGATVSAIRGYEPDETAPASDGSSNASPAASLIDPGALYFGTRLFVNPNNQQQDGAAGDEEAGAAAMNGEGELGALEVLRRVNNTAPFHQTKTLNCPIYLKKTSLSLVPVLENTEEKQKATKFGLQFVFDTCTSCAVTVFYASTEVFDKDNNTFKYVLFFRSFVTFSNRPPQSVSGRNFLARAALLTLLIYHSWSIPNFISMHLLTIFVFRFR